MRRVERIVILTGAGVSAESGIATFRDKGGIWSKVDYREVSSPQGRFSADAALVDGQILDRMEAYGKHLFYWWANGLVGHVHLGLFGKFRVAAGPQVPAVQGMVRAIRWSRRSAG